MQTTLNPSEISELIKKRVEELNISAETRNEGTVVSVSDGISRIHGLEDAMQGEMIEFPQNTFGLALNLERDSVGTVILGDYEHITEGDTVKCTGRILEVPQGHGLLGRVVDALGNPIDGQGPVENDGFSPIEKVAPGVIWRQSVSQPVQTGLKSIDSMIPIGRGQRELIIGDRQIGKSAIAIDTIINQVGTGIKCVYVAIGQKQSTVANVVAKLEEHGAMEHTIVVNASASESAAMQYIAPYSGCTMGEYFRDRGEDALIIYDDLTKQAWAYRQVSLLLRRPPGREAYPGDVFYLHSRLLERAARVNTDWVERFTEGKVKGKTGSLTALPIIETQAGDVSAFVPTNVISITDGQIFLDTDMFNAGVRPAVHAGLSVSRVGGAAQTKVIKKLGGGIRLALSQYRELAAFAQFASDLDDATRKQLDRGQRVTELMKQKQYSPLSVGQMAVSLFAADRGFLDDVELKKIGAFESALLDYMSTSQAELLSTLDGGDWNDEVEAQLAAAVDDFKSTGTGKNTMASSKEITGKIKSIENTKKVTSALEMVSASKIRKSQEMMNATRPYTRMIRRVMGHLSKANPEYRHPFTVRREETRKVGYIIVSTDRGLCGGLNINLFKLVLGSMREWQDQGAEVSLITLGKKASAFFKNLKVEIAAHASGLGEKPQIEDLIGSIKVMLDAYREESVDLVYIVYNDFINTMSQRPVLEQLLPLPDTEDEEVRDIWDYIYEPDAEALLDTVLVRYIEADVYHAVLENLASEHAARMIAMKSATDNAGELIDELTLAYNKARQAAITQEISEIVGGAAAV